MTSTNLKIRIDAAAGAAAPYEQLRAQIADRARSGKLPTGFKLPTVRGLAQELGLAANTVAKAYRALEADGVVETRGRNGTFVAASGEGESREAAVAAQAYAERVHRLGLTQAEAMTAAADALRARYGQ
ncbi:GntR family transcriptional regulator [Streptomyces sp. NPDC091268]|uniref:GntR family transcriptional regulator n=1 Tax=Streptomyces sp. NPDC091268 TaxID=3365979 RepID=UPI00381BEA46